MKFLFFVFPILLHTYFSIGQSSIQPELGKRMPDFKLNNIKNFKTASATLKSFEGKWLVLDLWTLRCGTCIATFPKIDVLQKAFHDRVQFVLLGKNDHKYNKGIEDFFEKISKNKNINIASAFDTVLFTQWNVSSVPHLYIIDPNGILRFITDGRDMTEEKIDNLINGKEVTFYNKEIERIPFNIFEAYEEKLLYTSVLTKWKGENQDPGYELDLFVQNSVSHLEKGWSAAMVPLYALYNYAYIGRWDWWYHDSLRYGKVWSQPILQIKDSSAFYFDYHENVGLGTYNYFMKMPVDKISLNALQLEMQRSLKIAFGYEVTIENRMMPYFKIIANPGAEKKLRSIQPGKAFISEENPIFGFTLKNASIKNLIQLTTCNLPNEERISFLDETGINYEVDFTISTDMTNHESVRKALQLYGLDLLKDFKEMKVIVIKDP